MNFLSLKYIAFLAFAALCCYRLVHKYRNAVLLALSYLFYACFDIRFLPYIALTTAATYAFAIFMERRPPRGRKLALALAVIFNIGILFIFKYLGFALGLFSRAAAFVGLEIAPPKAGLILPLGLSFYIFQLTGYVIDVYRGDIVAERNIVDFALFASFFPGLVSGPIQRAPKMLPQYKKDSVWDYESVKTGLLFFLWGMFKKMVIADQLSVMVNTAYGNPAVFSGVQLLAASLAYTIQIYCDFSAYSQMAIGSAKILGFELPQNFDGPYLALSLKDFWRRWHISLTSWLRDYLYFPLGGNRRGRARTYLNIVIVFIVSGLWHGASLTFVAWGALHGLFQVLERMLTPVGKKLRLALRIRENSRLLIALRWLITFAFVNFAWVFFRADSLRSAVYVLRKILSIPASPLSPLGIEALGLSAWTLGVTFAFVALLFAVDFAQKRREIVSLLNRTTAPRFAVYFALIVAVLLFGYYGAGYNPQDFVYFKF